MWIQEVAGVCPGHRAHGEHCRATETGLRYGIERGNKFISVTNLYEEQQLPRELRGRDWRDSRQAFSQGYLFILFPD